MPNGNSTDFNDFRLITQTNEPDETPPPPFEADPAKLVYITLYPAARDFGMYKRAHDRTQSDIDLLLENADSKGIDTSSFRQRREDAQSTLTCVAGLIAEGGEHVVDREADNAVEQGLTALARIKMELEGIVSFLARQEEALAAHQSRVEALAGKARKLGYADGAAKTARVDGYIAYAANPGPVIARSTAAFDEVFEAIRSVNPHGAQRAEMLAHGFAAIETEIEDLLTGGVLVSVD
ncbi:MAG: hypothetical protein IPM23_01195 [Candidatus Melainabacteria bacterium]|nr:hypothetical protein [Candidatus Melainabacteria bacterium]